MPERLRNCFTHWHRLKSTDPIIPLANPHVIPLEIHETCVFYPPVFHLSFFTETTIFIVWPSCPKHWMITLAETMPNNKACLHLVHCKENKAVMHIVKDIFVSCLWETKSKFSMSLCNIWIFLYMECHASWCEDVVWERSGATSHWGWKAFYTQLSGPSESDQEKMMCERGHVRATVEANVPSHPYTKDKPVSVDVSSCASPSLEEFPSVGNEGKN